MNIEERIAAARAERTTHSDGGAVDRKARIGERIAAMRAGRAPQTEVATVVRKLRTEQASPEAEAEKAPAAEHAFDIATNTVAKIMERGDLSDKGKLEAVVQFLSAKDVNFKDAQKNFAEFEVYLTYEQSRRTQVSEQNIQRLMDELADGTKSTVKHILDDFNSVNVGAF
jgi:hypothetical protein